MAEDQDPTTDQPQGTRAIKDRNQRIREEAAEKRKARRDSDQRRANVQRNLGAGEMVDDAFARGTHAAQGWLKRHLNVLQWIIVLGAAGGIGWQIYSARHHKSLAKATDTLLAGITADFARVGEDEEVEADPQTGLADPRPHYADDSARLKAAEAAYRGASGNDNLKTLAQLALAGALFDQAKHKDALAAYQAVRGSALAQKDTEVRARSIEGVGLSQESLGDKEAARKAFHELSNTDSPLLSALGLYHEARLSYGAGDRDKAKELLKQALDKAAKAEGEEAQQGFVSQAARELLAAIDPSAVPPPPSKSALTPEQLQALAKQAGGDAGGDKSGTPGLSKEKLDELLRQLKQQAPPAPSGAPAGKP